MVLRLAASRRARSRSASSSRTVVLMRQSILSVCQYVKSAMGCKGARVQISALRPIKTGLFRLHAVTFYTGDMGDTFAARGLAALSTRHVSSSKKPES